MAGTALGSKQQVGLEPGARESLGDLVALAVSDITQLLRDEVDLAKIELKADAKRVGIGAVLFGMAAFVGCLVLLALSFAYAYGLMTLGIWGWAAFLIVAGTYVVLAGLAALIGLTLFKRLTGLRKTRSSVSENIALIKREDSGLDAGPAGAR